MGPGSGRKINSKTCLGYFRSANSLGSGTQASLRETLLRGMRNAPPGIFENDDCLNCFRGYFGC